MILRAAQTNGASVPKQGWMIDMHRLLAGRVLVSNTPCSQRLYAHRSAVQHNDMAVQEAESRKPLSPALLALKAQPGVAHGGLRAVRELAGVAALVQRARLADVAQRPLHGDVCNPGL